MKVVPPGATDEERKLLFFEFCQALQGANPSRMLPLGVQKK